MQANSSNPAHRYIALFLLLILDSFGYADDWVYTVRPGDNLWNIADEFLVDWSYRERLQEYNNIPNGDVIQPGSLLNIPVPWLKVQPASAKLIAFSGKVEVLRADGTSSGSPEPGDVLHAEDSVITSVRSSAVVEFADGSRIYLDPDTSVVLNTISSFDQNGMIDTSFRLRGGRVESRVNPAKSPETRFRVLTPPAIAAVKGTNFVVAYLPDDEKTLAEVDTGLLGVKAVGVEVELPSGFGSATIQGEAPGQPVKRLPAIDLSGLQKAMTSDPITFVWPAVSGTEYYAIELLETASTEIVLTQQNKEPELQLQKLGTNAYILRVRAVDDIGLRSELTTHSFEVFEKPAAPLIISPVNDSDHIDTGLSFNWASNTTTAGEYNFQLYEVSSFASLLIDAKAIPQSSFLPSSALSPGQYYWRVSFTSSDAISSDWSSIQRFTVHEKPTIPVLTDIHLQQESLVSRWEKQDHAIAYRIEISTDEQFGNIIHQQRTEKTSYLLENAPVGQLNVRVASIGRVDFISDYSDMMSIEKMSFWAKYSAPIGIIAFFLFLAVIYRRIG